MKPSESSEVLRADIAKRGPEAQKRTTLLKCAGDEIPKVLNVDFILSIGVLRHIPVMKAAFKALPKGGKILAWIYGKEGNGLYLFFIQPLRKFIKLLPNRLLDMFVWLLYFPMMGYAGLCHSLPLPLRNYLVNVIVKMRPEDRRLVIYDQLNPSYAKYHTKHEAEELLKRNGFAEVRLHHRRGYSWTVLGTK